MSNENDLGNSRGPRSTALANNETKPGFPRLHPRRTKTTYLVPPHPAERVGRNVQVGLVQALRYGLEQLGDRFVVHGRGLQTVRPFCGSQRTRCRAENTAPGAYTMTEIFRLFRSFLIPLLENIK